MFWERKAKDLATLYKNICPDNCPVLKKSIRKIVLFESRPFKYALYIEETDRFILINEKEIDRIIELSKLTDGLHNIREIMGTDEENQKANAYALTIMDKFHLFDDSQVNEQFSETSILSKKICNFSLPIPNRFAKIFYWIYWLILTIFIILIGSYLFFNNVNIIEHYQKNVSEFDGVNYLISLLLTIPIFVMHEFAHVATACKYKLNRKLKIHIALYFYFFPYIYVKIPGLYTIKRSNRIHVLISGVCANFLLGVCFVLLNVMTDEGIFLSIALSNFQIAFVNLMPFNLTDGYFILSNLFKSYNLRKNYFFFISNIGKKLNYNFGKIEWAYLMVSFSYLIIFMFVEARIYVSAFFHNISGAELLFMSILFTVFAIVFYIVFIKLRMKKTRGSVNGK